MEFYWSGWAVLTIALYLAIGCTASFRALAREDARNRRYYGGRFWGEVIIWTLGTCGLALLAAGLIAFAGGGIFVNTHNSDSATTHDVTEHFGLESGVAYPMDIGTRAGSPGGSALAQTGFFYSSARVDLANGSTMPLSFVWQDEDGQEFVSMLEIPISKIDFRIDEVATPKAVLVLSNIRYDEEWTDAIWRRTDCRSAIVNLTFATRCTGEMELYVSPGLTLPSAVSSSLSRATITLTQEQYNALMGTV